MASFKLRKALPSKSITLEPLDLPTLQFRKVKLLRHCAGRWTFPIYSKITATNYFGYFQHRVSEQNPCVMSREGGNPDLGLVRRDIDACREREDAFFLEASYKKT